MSYNGLRDWLAQVDAIGELRTLEEIDWNLEMGAVVDVLYREHPPLSARSGFRQDQGLLNRS
jgi:3-polyprenyl-4-hydroxybenzoate decarboxylase